MTDKVLKLSFYNFNFRVCFFLSIFFNPAVFSAEQVQQYDIPAQSLNNALLHFAAESDLTLIFTSDKVRGLKSKALQGKHTAKQAIELLLQESGYKYQFIDINTVTITPVTKTDSNNIEQKLPQLVNQSNSVKVLQPLTVLGKGREYRELGNKDQSYSRVHTRAATRTDSDIKSIPQSIQVITQPLINDQASLTVSESLRNISGVSTGSSQLTPSFDLTQIRGFPAEQLLDGFTQYYNAGDRESLVNIERIEVLKGSNALLYGGGSGAPSGGLVNIVSKLPEDRATREAGVRYGSYQYYQPYFDINQPINQHVLFRVTAEYTHSDSYINVIETERYNINPALIITDHDSTQLTLQGKFSSWEQVDYQGLPAYGTITGEFSIMPDLYIGPKDIEPSEANFNGVWAGLDHTLNELLSLSIKARYTQSDFDQKIQTIFGADGIQAGQPLIGTSNWALFNTQLYQQQQEISLVANVLAKFELGPTENKVLIGGDYSEFKDEGFIESGSSLGLVDLKQPVFSEPYVKPGQGINNIFVTNKTYGAYIQLQSTLYDQFHLLAGVRLGSVSIDYNNMSTGFEAKAATLKTKFLPKLGFVYELTNNLSWFMGYSEGMRGQPFVNFVATPEPELSRHIESGLKINFQSGLSGQLAVYQIDRNHIAIIDNTDAKRRSKTTGKQRSQGIELDLTWKLNNEISLLSSYAYTDAQYINHQPATLKGRSLPHVADQSGKFWFNYQFSQAELSGLSMGAGIYAQSGVYLENSDLQSNGFYKIDAAVNYTLEHIKVSLALKNLTDEHYFESLNYFGGRFVPAQPFSTYLSFSMRY